MRTTVSLDDAQTAYVDEVRASADDSDAQAIRDVIEHAQALEDEVAELETEVDDLRDEVETLKSEKESLLERRDRLQSIEQRMATSDEIETFKNRGVVSWIRDRLR